MVKRPLDMFPRHAPILGKVDIQKRNHLLPLRWVASQRREVDIFENLRIGFAGGNQLPNTVVLVCDAVLDTLAIHDVQELSDSRGITALALTDNITRRASKEVEEVGASIRRYIRKLHGPDSAGILVRGSLRPRAAEMARRHTCLPLRIGSYVGDSSAVLVAIVLSVLKLLARPFG